VHLGGHDGAGKDTATNGDHAGEWALLVDVGTLNGVLGRAEAQTDVLVPSPVAGVLARSTDLVVQEDVRLSRRISIVKLIVAVVLPYLLLVSALGLDTVQLSAVVFEYSDTMLNVRELGSHFCGRVVLSVVFLGRNSGAEFLACC
jgi:hypothetical protein